MKKLMNILSAAALLAMVLAVFVGCDDATVGLYEVGDELAGGFVVASVDSLGGYTATRDFDEDDDDVVDEYQTLVSGRFGTDMTWSKDRVYYLSGAVFIGNDNDSNCTLTIEAGTTVKGEVSTIEPGVLVITRGSEIDAQGTASEPIIFTSANDEGKRASGDWGGIVLNGNALINDGDDDGQASGEGSTGYYGGDDDTDSSGTLKYVRVEFAGTLFTTDNELNGIAFQGVGNGTTVDYIQVHKNADDGIEFFGGAVDVSHVVITGAEDDSMDWTSGWTGTAQYVILQQYTDLGDKLLEADSNKNDATATPISNPTLKNLTMIAATNNGKDTVGTAHFRRGTKATLVNCIYMDGGNIDEDGDAGITFDGVITNSNVTSTQWDAAVTANSIEESVTLNIPAVDETDLDVMPTSAPSVSISLSSDGAAYWGAIDPSASAEWYAGWTATPAN